MMLHKHGEEYGEIKIKRALWMPPVQQCLKQIVEKRETFTCIETSLHKIPVIITQGIEQQHCIQTTAECLIYCQLYFIVRTYTDSWLLHLAPATWSRSQSSFKWMLVTSEQRLRRNKKQKCVMWREM